MSLQFSDTTTKHGIIQVIEKELGAEYGDISGNTERLHETTVDVNMAWDTYVYLALKASGTWQFGDSNHTKYGIIYAHAVQGQSDYPFTTDEQGNLILDIYKVRILPSATATEYVDLDTFDRQQHPPDTTQGVPAAYDKTENAIFFDRPFSYNVNKGVEMHINREASYFTYTDTTKKPGCPGIHHRYFAVRASFEQARRDNLASYDRLREEVIGYEGDEERGITGSIERYFARRSRDERPRMTMKKVNYI